MIIFLGITPPNVYAKDTCLDCHKDPKFRAQNKKLYDYYKYWENSIHDLAGVKCVDCHGGKSDKVDKDASHKYKFITFGSEGKGSFKQIPLVCGRCHKEALKSFIASNHYKALREKGTGSHCVTCHGSMNTGIFKASAIAKECEVCHNEETKNNPGVGLKAKDILRHFNIIRSYRNFVSVNYSDENPQIVNKMNSRYKDLVFSWHTFNFAAIDENSMELMNDLKSLVNKKILERKKKKKS
jgi:formate-dependent nitrite reductase cytochrome c552 subunit